MRISRTQHVINSVGYVLERIFTAKPMPISVTMYVVFDFKLQNVVFEARY